MPNPSLNCPICSSHEETIVNQITAKLTLRKFRRGTEICSQSEPCHGLFIIGSGTAKVSRLAADGRETVLAMLSQGDTFGEASLQTKNLNEAITAISDVDAFFLHYDDLAQILSQHPTLYPSVFNAIIRWVDRLNQVIDNISTSSAKSRVARYIKTLVDENPNGSALCTIELPFKKHEVALMLGLRPETLSRAFNDLEQEGAIRLDHKKIHILNSCSL